MKKNPASQDSFSCPLPLYPSGSVAAGQALNLLSADQIQISRYRMFQGGGGHGKFQRLFHLFSLGQTADQPRREGIAAAHLGDLGHQLSPEQIAAVGPVDLVMVPVGGTYTVDAAGAKQVCEALAPTWIVPMHYRHAPFGLPNVGTVGDFLALWRPEQIHRLEGPSLELPLRSPGVWVPEFV